MEGYDEYTKSVVRDYQEADKKEEELFNITDMKRDVFLLKDKCVSKMNEIKKHEEKYNCCTDSRYRRTLDDLNKLMNALCSYLEGDYQ